MVQGNGPNFANLVRLSWPFQRVSTVWPISAKVSPWWGKSTEHDQNAWNPKFDPFHYVKAASKLEKSTNCSHNLISSEGGQDTSACKNFRPFPQWVFQIPENAWKPQIWPVSLSQNSTKIRQIHQSWGITRNNILLHYYQTNIEHIFQSIIYHKKIPNLVAKILATKFGFVPDCYIVDGSVEKNQGGNCYHVLVPVWA